jgi:pimeloyl-ACP methyl ester carboxylesterase
MSTSHTPQDQYVYGNGLRLHYLDWGNESAPPMLLLHGFTGHAHTWDTFAAAMCDRFHVIALDQRGHGDSDWSKDGAYTVDDHTADIYAVYTHLQLAPVVLVGLSMGGRHAIRYTARHASTVAMLVIVDIGPDINPRGAERVRQTAANAPEEFASPEAAFDYLKQTMTHPSEAALRHRITHGIKQLPTGAYTWKYDAFLRQQRRQGSVPVVNLWPDVQRLNVTTLIVRGADSDIFAPETAQRMHNTIPGSALVNIPHAGHSVPADAPEAFTRAVRAFIDA